MPTDKSPLPSFRKERWDRVPPVPAGQPTAGEVLPEVRGWGHANLLEVQHRASENPADIERDLDALRKAALK